MAKPVTLDMPVGKLAPGTVNQIIRLLQLNNNWETVAAAATRRTGTYMFEMMDVELMRQYGPKAAQQMFRNFMTEGYTVRRLLDLMVETQLYNVADYINMDVLHGEQTPRRERQFGRTPDIPPPKPPPPHPRPGPTQNTTHIPPPKPPPPHPRPGPTQNTTRGDTIKPENYDSGWTGQSHHVDRASGPASANPDGGATYRPESAYNQTQHSHHSGNVSGQASANAEGGDSWTVRSHRVTHTSGSASLKLEGWASCGSESSDSQTFIDDPAMYSGLTPINLDTEIPYHFTYNLLDRLTHSFNEIPKCKGGRLLGSGGFGHVFYARYNNHQLAVKRLCDQSPATEREINTEIKTMSRVRHMSILPLVGYSDDGIWRCIVYPYMRNGSLEDCLACRYNQTELSAPQRLVIAKGLAEAIQCLHAENIIHRDIKSANVLIDDHFLPKLGDFGIAQLCPSLADNQKTSTFTKVVQGTRAYIAPETFQSGKISYVTDVYSYGVVLLELLTGLKPFDDTREDPCLSTHVAEECGDDLKLMMKMADDKLTPPFPDHVFSGLFSLALGCLADRSRNRPTTAVVLEKLSLL